MVFIYNLVKYLNLEYCEVVVYFCEVMDFFGGGYEVILDLDLVIFCKVFRNNFSVYYINGKIFNFIIVIILFWDCGVDFDYKCFLIL